jgi:hypothetical protein
VNEIVSSQNSYVDIQTPNVIEFGCGAFWRYFGLDEVILVSTLIMVLVSIEKEGEARELFLSLCPFLLPVPFPLISSPLLLSLILEIRHPYACQKESSHQETNQTRSQLDLEILSYKDYEK